MSHVWCSLGGFNKWLVQHIETALEKKLIITMGTRIPVVVIDMYKQYHRPG